tara:strand:- start:4821 stop:5177 length:357 start_codon:yes stop_codon:yes gene_type:complete
MTPEEFVKKVRKYILEDHLIDYKTKFENTVITKEPNNYWSHAIYIFHKLDDKEKETWFKIMRLVSVEAIAVLLATIDGIACLEAGDPDLCLSVKNEEKLLNGELSNIFLEIEEEMGEI